MNGNDKMEEKDRDPEEIAMMPRAGWGNKGNKEPGMERGCGIGGCRPRLLKGVNGIWSFTIIFGLSTLLTSSLKTYLSTQVVFLERQYELSSRTTGLLVSCTDIGFVIFVLFSSYFARRWNVPRILAMSTALFGLAAIICVLPHAITKDDLHPPPVVTPNNSYSLLKLQLKAPSCIVGNLPPEVMSSMMTKMMKPGGGMPNLAELMSGKNQPVKAPVTPRPQTSYKVTTTKKPLVSDTEHQGEEKPDEVVITQLSTVKPDINPPDVPDQPEQPQPQPQPQPTVEAEAPKAPDAVPKPEGPLIMPNFTKLALHPKYPEFIEMAKMFGIDLLTVSKMKHEDQVNYVNNLPPKIKALLPNMKLMLGPDADSYFYIQEQPKSRRRRDTGERINVAIDMMYSGMLSEMMKNLPPFSDSDIDDLVAKLCPFNTGEFHLSASSGSIAVALIAVGMILQGIAQGPRFTFAALYVDDGVDESRTGLHVGLIACLGVLGLAFAYGFGGIAATSYVTMEDTGSMTLFNPRWLSAWWLGYLIYGILSLVLAVPILMFPKTLSSGVEPYSNGEKKNKNKLGVLAKNSKGLAQSLCRLLSNPLFVLISLANAASVLAVVGIITFLPKYVENQFSLPPFGASVIVGLVYVVASGFGTVVGGIVTSKWKLSPSNCLKMTVVLAGILVVIQGCLIGFGCEQPTLDKGDKIVGNSSTKLCSSTCVCVKQMYAPVCGSDGISYYSACHAGCGEAYNDKYNDCKCIDDSVRTATPGLCKQPCNFFYVFCVFLMLSGFLLHMKAMPAFLATLRSVESRDAPLAIGFNLFLTTIAGCIPSPVLFGAIFDSACTLMRPPCGMVGPCAIYDIVKLRLHLFGVSTAVRAAAALLYVAALFLGLRSNSVYETRIHEKERRK